ncbi:helix-turn-helix domain-containing protein [Dinghuibacter silviterrae]|uniref:Helix-turn-helix protein n=1 Tax=Dinghuibacter silviterrae TaxID=1539049 RepID=A0A4R8DU72_9BACT|nr:helix-turn-helix transcriptional regulator [Dinghuibacter silviterrae]TDX01466.1 helix-turn-helix protein [Dinghuibacter silviterrae]
MTTIDKPKKVHEGRNVKRFRELLSMKQETLAAALGEDWYQKKVSQLEQEETIDPEVLERVAKALKIPADAIKNFDEEGIYNFIGNTVTNNQNVAFVQYSPVFNPLEKWIEAMEENKKLYERLLESERQKVEILQNQMSAKK